MRPRTELGPVPRPYRGTALLRGRRLSVAGRPAAPRGEFARRCVRGPGARGRAGLRPVSYTHLDVYKRQP